MRVRLLGSGGFMPSDRRETACALVVEDGDGLLIDAGTGARRLVTEPGLLDGVDRLGVVLTHFHLDHVLGLFYLGAVERPIDVWGAGEALERISTRSLVERLVGPPFAPPGFVDRFTVRELDPAGENVLGSFAVRTRTQHLHSNPTVALRVGDTLVWCTDTAYDEENVDFARGARMLFHEAFSAGEGEADHTASAKAAGLARDAGVERLVLIHVDPALVDDGSLLERARPIFPSVELGRDGLVLEVAS
jgi:ribonuclease Z